jgi:hypothetical protein
MSHSESSGRQARDYYVSRKGAKTQRETLKTRQRFASLRLCARHLPADKSTFVQIQTKFSMVKNYWRGCPEAALANAS